MNAAAQHRVSVAGASGRMGRMLIEAVRASGDCALTGALDVAASPAIGQDAGAYAGQATGVTITADFATALRGSHCLIDFTRPEGTMAHLDACVAHGVNLVIGTTGFSDEEKARIAEAGKKIAIVMAPNMSVGVNVTLKLLEMAAKAMATGYDIEIIEAHHRHKVDAPSGTALQMGEVIARAQGQRLADVATFAREGHTGPREAGRIGFAVVRGGDIIGDHTAMFCGEGERIEISHRSSSRVHYAQGALAAARFLAQPGRRPGRYAMADVVADLQARP